jgi:hypothetical protein
MVVESIRRVTHLMGDFGICGQRGHHPAKAPVEDAVKWIRQWGLSDPLEAPSSGHFVGRVDSKAYSVAVSAGTRIYSQIQDYQRTVRMTPVGASLLRSALDLLRARLRFFGRAV